MNNPGSAPDPITGIMPDPGRWWVRRIARGGERYGRATVPVRQCWLLASSHQVPVSISIDSRNASAAYRAFLQWAEPRGSVRVLFNPDSMLAIDGEEARGFLVDDVYAVSVWVDRGQESFVASLESEVAAIGLDVASAVSSSSEPNPLPVLHLIMERGQNIDKVRHLL